jgi:hypothetical protein
VDQTVALWQKCFRKTTAPASAAVRQYFADVLLKNPWFTPEFAPLVLVHHGEIAGFQGRIARPMYFGSTPIRCVVSTQLMVDPHRRLGFAALDLVRAVHGGPQDLCYSDGANPASMQMWMRAGGDASRLFSLEWMRALRPLEASCCVIRRRRWFRPVAKVVCPLAGAADACLARLAPAIFRPARSMPPVTSREASPAEILALLRQVAASALVRPDYTDSTFAWILDRAAEARAMGPLRRRIVLDANQAAVGWFIYYVQRGAAAHVLQAGAMPRHECDLVSALLCDAWEQGAATITGQFDPSLLTVLTQFRCRFQCWDFGVLVHSRHPELRSALDRGDAFLSRLEGEWWLRLGIDRNFDW